MEVWTVERALCAEMRRMRVSGLRARAVHVGAEVVLIEAVCDGSDPKRDILEVIVESWLVVSNWQVQNKVRWCWRWRRSRWRGTLRRATRWPCGGGQRTRWWPRWLVVAGLPPWATEEELVVARVAMVMVVLVPDATDQEDAQDDSTRTAPV